MAAKKTFSPPTPSSEAALPTRAPRTVVVAEPTINFKTWFVVKLKTDKRLKVHHCEAISVYMAGLGLKEDEPARKFEAGLAQYFG